MDMIYVLIVMAWAILTLGFWKKDYAITSIIAFFIIALGVYMAVNGITDTNDWITNSFATIHMGIGFYVLIRGGYEGYKNAF